MSRDFGWESPARRYLAIYSKLAPKAAKQNTDCDTAQDLPSEIVAA